MTEEALTADLVELARQYGRYGYRKISALLRRGGWVVNDKRVEPVGVAQRDTRRRRRDRGALGTQTMSTSPKPRE